jgi:DNA-binding transcriptional regulator WhiA
MGIGKGNHGNQKQYYNYNRNFFEKIDNPVKAYILGFIVSDGHIRKDSSGYYLMFSIKKEDKYLLESFCVVLGASIHAQNLVKRKSSNDGSYYLRFASKKLVCDLYSLGVPIKNKSLKAVPIDCKKYNQDFWRGMFDGDGSIGKASKNQKTPSLRITLTGTQEVCEGFEKYLGYNGYMQKHKNCYQYQKTVSKLKDMETIYSKIYLNCSIPFIYEKKDKFVEIIKEREIYEKNN